MFEYVTLFFYLCMSESFILSPCCWCYSCHCSLVLLCWPAFIYIYLSAPCSHSLLSLWACEHIILLVCFRGGAFSLFLCFSCLHTWKQLGNHSPAFNLMITHPLLKAEDFSQSNCCCHCGSKVELFMLCGCFCERICFSSLQMPPAMANLYREIHAGKGNLWRKICRKSKLWRDTP